MNLNDLTIGKVVNRRIIPESTLEAASRPDSINWEQREHRYTYYRRVCPHLPIESWMKGSHIQRHVDWINEREDAVV